MSKRRKRRRMAFITRMNEIIRENPTLSLDKAKTRTAIEVKSALRHADKTAPHNREEHTKVFEDTLFGKNKVTTTTTTSTTTPTTTTPTSTTTRTTTTKAQTTTTKPTTTTKTTTTKTKAAPKPKPATRARKTASQDTTTTTKKRTTTKRTKKAK